MKQPMTLIRLAVGVFCLGGLAAVALVARNERTPADQMTEAAGQFLSSLSDEQRKKAEFDFDDPHRTGWFFTPQQNKEHMATRKGLRLEELTADQKKKALALLKTGTSSHGYGQATTIMSLEQVLHDIEKKGTMVRNPNWYFVSVFGKPSKTGKWGWRIEGHHLSVNFTLDRGQVESPTPFLFGANPADVQSGPRKGLRTLPEVEDYARELIKALDGDQKKLAQQSKPYPEVAENTAAAKLGAPTGIPASKLHEKQRDILIKLMKAYTDRMPESVGQAEMKAANDAGIDKVYFGYSGTGEPGKPYTYQIQGPTFVAQFLNTQTDGSGNPANHIHSVWRRLPADFGLKVE